MNNKLLLVIALVALGVSARTWAADGAAVFDANCVSCHGTDGKARTAAGKKLRATDLTGSKLNDAEIESQIAEGTQDVNGKPRMPSFKAKLSAEEIAALVAFVKTFRH